MCGGVSARCVWGEHRKLEHGFHAGRAGQVSGKAGLERIQR